MEQHGPHMPVATDAMIAEAVVEGVTQAIEDIDLLVLPTLWCSKSNEHVAFPGTIFLTRETFVRVLEDISASVARTGFKKLVFMNWHGGNTDVLVSIIRDIRQQTGLMTFAIDIVKMLGFRPPTTTPADSFNIHAGHYETSILLAAYPELMQGRDYQGLGSDMSRGKTSASFNSTDFQYLLPEGGPVSVGWVTTDLTEDGVIGDPSAASAADGQTELDAQIDLICEILYEVAAFDYAE
jgi:creatinine amidohydrolase